ncbi:MAG: site-2 protease family protein [Myxococcales bacterium]|nr:site-2 protease family protein [Myxococcales bacterium]
MSEARSEPQDPWREWRLPALLFALTSASTLYAGARMQGGDSLLVGLPFAAPLMLILLAHEMGHYVAGRLHGVDASPPYFIPLPFGNIGTMGAIIQLRRPITSRRALLDVGAAGPLAGMAVALPVLIYGLATSPVEPLPPGGGYLIEGRGLLYLGLLTWLHDIPEGSDVMLNATAWAGWVGLLVTMINLLPIWQLDGGHVAYALRGPAQDRTTRWLLRALPLVAIGVGLGYATPAYLQGARGEALFTPLIAGANWWVWALVLTLLARRGTRRGPEEATRSRWRRGLDLILARSEARHPPTDGAPLGPTRRAIGVFTLLLFVLLFMPSWLRYVPPQGPSPEAPAHTGR